MKYLKTYEANWVSRITKNKTINSLDEMVKTIN